MRQVLRQVGVRYHGVLCVAEHVGLPVWCDRPQLDGQRIFLLCIVLQSVIVASRSVKELPVLMDRS